MTSKAEYAKRIGIWLRGLRQGGYKQARGAYHGKRGGHCCLGVGQIVCDLKLKESHRDLKKHLDLTDKEINTLIHYNDVGRRNFAYIADRIEKTILPRFV